MDLYEFFQGKYQFAELTVVGQPDCILKGKYCEVSCYQLSKQKEKERWHFSPHSIPVGHPLQPSSDEEWIANAISNTPNVDLFVNFNGFDQVDHWISHRDNCIEIALSFWSEQGICNDYLSKQLQDENLDDFSYHYLRAEARMYRDLWRILKIREQEIAGFCKKFWSYPFKSTRDFFMEAITEDLEGEFMACLSNRYLYKSSQIKQIAKLKRKMHKGNISENERKTLNKLSDQYVKFPTWFNRLILATEALAKKDDLVKEYFNEFGTSLDTLLKLQIQRDCDPKLRNHLIPSHTWAYGRYREGILPWNA
jgi:hypothetical protein